MEKTNLNVAPYFDDFDESKNFHRILFRPGYAVQGRELTQLQTILQNQIERLGNNILKDGSPVTGGQTNLYTDVTYVKLESTFGGLVLNVDQYDGAEIVDTAGRGARARIIAVAPESADPPTFMIRYVSGQEFLPSDTIALSVSPSVGIAKIRSDSDSIGLGSVAAILEGVFFVRGFFVHTPQQVVILDKYGVTPTYSVGLEITESIVTEHDDDTLLDPALDSSNFQAPGADRFSITLNFNKRAPSSIDVTEFIQLMTIENGVITEWVKYPIYNEIEKTLARRTYDQAGNYTVRAFRATVSEDDSNNANYIVTLDAGKAYVFGFEFETIAPTKISVPKPRTRTSINNYALSMNYGDFVFVQNANGFFDTSQFSSIDLHCVPSGNIDFSVSANYANTKIGTARIRDWVLESTGTISLANTYQYRAHLFDVNTISLAANSAGTNNTIGSVNLASGFSSVSNAYVGAILTVTAGTSVGDRRTITSYNGVTKIATVDANFSVIPDTTSVISLDFQFKDVESLAIRNVTGVNAFADIASSSKDSTTTFNDAFLTDTAFDSLIFELPYRFVVATDAANSITGIADVSYQYRKVFTPTLTANTVILNLSGAEQFIGSAGVQGSLQKTLDWFIEVTNPVNSTFGKGAVVPVGDTPTTITLTGTQTANITIAGGGNSTIAVVAIVNVTNGGRKTKTKVLANTTTLPTSSGQLAYDQSGVVVPGVNVYSSVGQVDFANNSVLPKTPDTDLSLYIPDVISLVKVVQSANSSTPVALADVSDPTKDITTYYTLDTGQKDGYYGMAKIRLKSGSPPPTGQIRVFVNYYDHDQNQGYFSVDSYPNANNQTGYADIPQYTSPSGRVFSLRDCIDFRPRKTIGFANTFTSPTYIAASETNFTLDFAYYLARIDNVVLTRDKQFDIVQGIDALIPSAPKQRDDAMLLNVLSLPPYISDAANSISIKNIENKRYTMRDIGSLEQRIQDLEYYTSLSLLEQATLTKTDDTILDDAGLERTKNGFIVDSFADFSAADHDSIDFRASIDTFNRRMKPSFISDNYDVFFYANGSIAGTYSTRGSFVMLPYDDNTSLVYQNLASKIENLNPFNVTKWAGSVGLAPPNDTWIDQHVTQIVTNPNAQLPLSTTQTLWENWTSLYHGYTWSAYFPDAKRAAVAYGASSIGVNPDVADRIGFPVNGFGGLGNDPNVFEFSIGYTTTAIRTIQYEEVRTALGTRILNTTIIPFIRSRAVNFSSKNVRPSTAYYPFFDGVPVLDYVKRANVIRLVKTPVSSGQFTEEVQDTYGSPDMLFHFDNFPPASATQKGLSCLLTYAANIGLTVPVITTQGVSDGAKASAVVYGDAEIANTTTNAIYGVSHLGNGLISGVWFQISQYEHYSGNVVSATSSTVRISTNAHANAYFFSPSIGTKKWSDLAAFSSAQWAALGDDGVVRIVGGTGAGQSRQILSYALATNTLSVNTAWTTTPDSTSVYSIGLPRSVETGHIGGVFNIPNTSIMQFRTGDRVFRLTDSPTNNDNLATSIAIGKYSASGSLQEVQQDVLVTRRVKSITDTTTQGGIVAIANEDLVALTDPLAQSFIVDARTYPNGVFLSKLRFCFASKDFFLPVTLQVRTMVNGFPNSKEVIDQVSLNPQYVKTTSLPNLNDANKYTEFKFVNPIFLAAGQEYAFVLLSDSNQYNIYVSEVGGIDIASGAQITKQPTLGSLFKSQNSSTWTPVQEEDLMFAINICKFDTTKTANVNFRISPLAANANVDVFYFSSVSLSPPTTDIDFKFTSELISGGLTGNKAFIPNITTYFDDALGRRVFKANSNTSFTVTADMTSTNQWVSPAIDISSGLSVFGIQYQINNGELSNNNIVITNQGTGYLITDNSNVQITISGGGGSGATAKVNAISNGAITSIVLTNPGSGYYTTPSLAINFIGNTTMRAANTNVAATILGETSTRGGNAQARYVMKKVKLADGFDSSDLRVYLTAYKPQGSQIYVYYKVLSAEDPDVFDNKPWTQMTQLGNTLVTSPAKDNIIEFTYAPGTNGDPSKEIIYNGYNTFRYFAIKVVSFATNLTDVPEFRNIRVIALPSGKVI